MFYGILDVVFPINAYQEVLEYRGGIFIPVISHPGVIVITVKPSASEAVARTISTVMGCWPILAVNFFLMVIAGIIIWFCVSQQVKFQTFILLQILFMSILNASFAKIS